MKKIVLILILFTSQFIYSQTINMVGMLDLGKAGVEAEYGSDSETIYAASLGFRFGVIDKFAVEFRPGLVLFNDNYSGYQLGFLGRYNITQKLYGVAGLNLMFQNSAAHGNQIETRIFDDTYPELYLGFAITTGHFGVNLGYSLPFTKVRGSETWYDDDSQTFISNDIKVNYAIRLGLEIGFVIE